MKLQGRLEPPYWELAQRGITQNNWLDNLDNMTDEEVYAMLKSDPRGGKWEDFLRASPSMTPRKLAEGIRDFSL